MRRGISMIAGLPGTGIGGLFYLLMALWMSIREFYSTLRRRSNPERWRAVSRHTLLTACIIIGMWATGWLLGWLIELTFPAAISYLSTTGIHVTNLIQVTPFLFTLATLVSVNLGVHVLRIIVGLKNSHRAEQFIQRQ
ncbi:MAG: hypothetical protein ABOK23_04755 [Candidatus Methanoperedens sp.]